MILFLARRNWLLIVYPLAIRTSIVKVRMPNREQRPLLPRSDALPPTSTQRSKAPTAAATRSTRRTLLRRRATSLRRDIWTVLRYRSSITNRSGLQLASYVLEVCILTLVLLNVVLAISESSALVTPAATTARRSEWYDTFLYVSTIIFSIEYALRFWSCVEDERYNSAILGRLKWMTRPMSIIDLVSLLPFYLEIFLKFLVIPAYPGALTLRSLRLLRIISFLRLERSYSAMTNLRLIFGKKKEELLVVTYLTTVIVLTSSTTIFFLENAAQPKVFSSVAVSAWWSVETITSLGYGDMVPQTSAGRLFGAVLALWGIILFTIPGAILGSAFIEVMLEQQRRLDEDELSVVLRSSFTEIPNGSGLLSRHASDGDLDRYNMSSPASQSATQSFRRLSPRVATIMRMDTIAQRLDEMAAAQSHLQQQMIEQRKQMDELRRLMEVLVARSE